MMALNFNFVVASSFYWPIGHIITYLLYLGCSDGQSPLSIRRGRLSVCHVTPSSIHWWWWWSGTIMCKSSNVMASMLCGNLIYMWKGFITFFVLPPYFFMLTHPYPFLQREKKPFLHPKHCYIAVFFPFGFEWSSWIEIIVFPFCRFVWTICLALQVVPTQQAYFVAQTL